MVKRDTEMYKVWRLPGFFIVLWVLMFLLYSCHAVPAKEYNIWIMQKNIRCMPKWEAMELMVAGEVRPLLTGIAEVLMKTGETGAMPTVFFADSETGRWALVQLGSENDACIIEMGGNINFSPDEKSINEIFNYIPGEKS